MSRTWTAISINPIGGCGRHEFIASYDYSVAREVFGAMHPNDTLVALMPGTRPECQTYDISAPATEGSSIDVDPFSLRGLNI